MSVRVPVTALLACAFLAAPAVAQERGDVLVAQLAQATQEPGDQPPLTTDPPTELGSGEGDPTPTPTPTPTATATESPSAEPREQLADTGADPALLALAGLGLLGMGVSLRLAVPDGARG
jgi:hypothetical protein